MEVLIAAKQAFPLLFFAGTFGYGHLEFIMAFLAFIFPFVSIEDIDAGTQGRPDRRFRNVRALTLRAVQALFTFSSGLLYFKEVPAFQT